jgi:hypothetical protein
MNRLKTIIGYIMCFVLILSSTLFVNYTDVQAPVEKTDIAVIDIVTAPDKPTHKPSIKQTIEEADKVIAESEETIAESVHQEQVSRIKHDPILASRSGTYNNPHAVEYNSNDIDLMARMIMAEGGNQPFNAKLGMATVMVNRVFTWFGSEHFYSYDKLKKVLLNYSQFNAVENERWFASYVKFTSYVPSSNKPNDECYVAARAILNGYRSWDGDESVVYFYAVGYHVDGAKQVEVIGDTEFGRSQ